MNIPLCLCTSVLVLRVYTHEAGRLPACALMTACVRCCAFPLYLVLTFYRCEATTGATSDCGDASHDTSADVAGLVIMYDTLVTSAASEGGASSGSRSAPTTLQLELLDEIKTLAGTFASHGPEGELKLWRRALTTLLAHVPAPASHICASSFPWSRALLRRGWGAAGCTAGDGDTEEWTERHPSSRLTGAVLSVVVDLYLHKVCTGKLMAAMACVLCAYCVPPGVFSRLLRRPQVCNRLHMCVWWMHMLGAWRRLGGARGMFVSRFRRGGRGWGRQTKRAL